MRARRCKNGRKGLIINSNRVLQTDPVLPEIPHVAFIKTLLPLCQILHGFFWGTPPKSRVNIFWSFIKPLKAYIIPISS